MAQVIRVLRLCIVKINMIMPFGYKKRIHKSKKVFFAILCTSSTN